MAANCGGSPYATATLYRTQTSVVPTTYTTTYVSTIPATTYEPSPTSAPGSDDPTTDEPSTGDTSDEDDGGATNGGQGSSRGNSRRYAPGAPTPAAYLAYPFLPRQDDEQGNKTTITSTYTSSYTTTFSTPTRTLYTTPAACPTTTDNDKTTSAQSSAPTSAPSSQASSSSAAASSHWTTMSDGSGSTYVVFVTSTQDSSSIAPVIVTAVESPAPSSTGAVTNDTSTSSGSSHARTGAIAGGVVGAIAAIGIIAALVWFSLRRRRLSREDDTLNDLFKRSTGGIENLAGASRGNSRSSKRAMAGSNHGEEGDMMEEQLRGSLALSSAHHHGTSLQVGGSAGWGAHDRLSTPPTWGPLDGWATSETPQSFDGHTPPENVYHADLNRSRSDNSRIGQFGVHQGTHSAGHESVPSQEGMRPSPSDGQVSDALAAAAAAAAASGALPLRPNSAAGLRSPPSSPPTFPGQLSPASHHAPHQSISSAQWYSLSPPPGSQTLDSSAANTRPRSPSYFPPTRSTSPPVSAPNTVRNHQSLAPRPTSGSGRPASPNPPMMWRAPADAASSSRLRTQSGGSFTQLMTVAGAQQRQQSPPPTSPTSHSHSAHFGVQSPPAPTRRQTASPPPLGSGYDQNWPPSRYNHLDLNRDNSEPNLWRPSSPPSAMPSYHSASALGQHSPPGTASNRRASAGAGAGPSSRPGTPGAPSAALDPPSRDNAGDSLGSDQYWRQGPAPAITPIVEGHVSPPVPPASQSKALSPAEVDAEESEREASALRETERKLLGARHVLFIANDDGNLERDDD